MTRRSILQTRHALWRVLVATVLVLPFGCAAPSPRGLQRSGTQLVWPPAPAPPRIRYAGQLQSSADVERPGGFVRAFGEFIVGKREPQRMYGPRAVCCTHGGDRVWVADPGGRRVHVFDLARNTYQAISRMGDAALLSPVDVTAGPNETLLLCDSEAVAVHQVSVPDGSFVRTLRLPEDILRPVAVHYEHARGELFVVDAVAHDIKVLDMTGRLLRIVGRRGDGPAEFNFPCEIAEREGTLWVVDAGNHRIQGLTPTGRAIEQFGQEGDAPGDLALPKGIAFDSHGHAYVVDSRFENVQIFDASGRLLLFFGHEGTGEGEFWLPSGVFVDENDRIWVCDTYNGRLQAFDYVGP